MSARANASAPLVRFAGVHKRFGDKTVLAGVDLEVAQGETLALVGASGSGKTVLIKSLVGLTRVDDGAVRFDGVDVASADERVLARVRPRIGFVFQASALFDSLTVGDNVGYALHIRPHPDAGAIATRVAECLSLVGLAGTEPMWPGELSGGMRKRVAVARAVAAMPELVLYDEPTAGLDPVNVGIIARLIRSVRQTLGATALVVTHDRDLVSAVADRVALIADGRIAWQGTLAEAQQRPPELSWFWGEAAAELR